MIGRALVLVLLVLVAAAPARAYPSGRDSTQDYNSAIALYNQGISFENRGEYEKAITWFKLARAAAPDDSLRADADRRIGESTGRLLLRQGVRLFDTGKLTDSRRKFAAALLQPIDPDEKAYARRYIRRIDELLKPAP